MKLYSEKFSGKWSLDLKLTLKWFSKQIKDMYVYVLCVY